MSTNLEDLIEDIVQNNTGDVRPADKDQIVAVALGKTVQSVRENIHAILQDPGVEKWSELLDFGDLDRNKEIPFQTMFENFDQKANQLFNILSTVIKGMKEMKSSTKRNIL